MLEPGMQTQTLTRTKTIVKVALIAGGIMLAAAAVGGTTRLKEIFYSGGLNIYSDYYPSAGAVVKASRGLNELFGFSMYADKESVDVKSIKFYFVPQANADGRQMVNTFKNIKLYQKKRSSGYGYGYQYYNSYSLQQVGATVSQLTVDVNRPNLAFVVVNFSPAVRIDANGYSDNSFILTSEIAANNSWTGSFSVQIDEGKDVVGAGAASGRGISGASVNVKQAKGNWLKAQGITPVPVITTLGDVDKSGQITSGDALLALKYANGNGQLSEDQKKAADVNGDGKITKEDSDLILQYSVGAIKSFPTSGKQGPIPLVTLLGDANLNGRVDIGDSLFIAQYAVGKRQLSVTAMANADVNGDGAVTKADADMIAQYLVGKIKTFPAVAGVLSVSVSATPLAQNVIRGITGFTFANFVFNAGNAKEDIKITSIDIQQKTDKAANAGNVTNLQLFDGSVALNTGSNTVNPSTKSANSQWTFTLDNALVIPKGTSKTIALRGNIPGNAAVNSFQQWGLASGAKIAAVGVASGNASAVALTSSDGQKMMVIGGGSYNVSLDSSTPTGKLIAAGTTGNLMTALKFRAVNEPIKITKIQLGLSNPNSSSNDLAQVYLYDGLVLLGRGILGFGNAQGGTNNALSTFVLEAPLQIQTNSEKIVTIKADVSPITTVNTVATAGHNVVIDYISSEAVGVSSGTKITDAKKTVNNAPAYIYRSVPTVSLVSLPSLTLTNGMQVISKFKVSADQKGDIDLYKLSIQIAANNVLIAGPVLVDVTNPAGGAVVWEDKDSLVKNDIVNYKMELLSSGAKVVSPRTISAGTSRTFELRGTVSGAVAGSSVTAKLLGDSQPWPLFPAPGNPGNFIWSDWSDVDHGSGTGFGKIDNKVMDWTNGYLVSGLPSAGLTQTLSK